MKLLLQLDCFAANLTVNMWPIAYVSTSRPHRLTFNGYSISSWCFNRVVAFHVILIKHVIFVSRLSKLLADLHLVFYFTKRMSIKEQSWHLVNGLILHGDRWMHKFYCPISYIYFLSLLWVCIKEFLFLPRSFIKKMKCNVYIVDGICDGCTFSTGLLHLYTVYEYATWTFLIAWCPLSMCVCLFVNISLT